MLARYQDGQEVRRRLLLITQKLIDFLSSGQMCISVDTLFVHKDEVKTFLDLAKQHLAKLGSYSSSADCTGMINQ